MDDLTVVVLGKKIDLGVKPFFKIIYFNKGNINDLILSLTSKYVVFVKAEDSIRDDYFDLIFEKIGEDLDCCFLNNKIDDPSYDSLRFSSEYEILKVKKPIYGEYIWNYMFKVELLKKVIDKPEDKDFNQFIEEIFVNTGCINEFIYFHNPYSDAVLDDSFCYCDVKKIVKLKNVIFSLLGCSGVFNGYVSWIRNIGKCFGDKYKLVFLYDLVNDQVKENFSNYMECIKRDNKVLYYCDSFMTTYSDYFYPRNIIPCGKSYLFIHGNMSDYEGTIRYHDDIYTDYVAVSKVAAERAVGYFPTDNIYPLHNPFKIDCKSVERPLRLVSAQRYADVKRTDRIVRMAQIMDELDIPYTWNLFTDKFENTNSGGLIYRKRVANPLPYIKEADYFVLFSDSEAMPYSIIEALSLNTKVVVTPLPAFNEVGAVDGDNAIIVPFDYFDECNKDKLIEVIQKMRNEAEKKFDYEFDPKMYEGYNDIFLS